MARGAGRRARGGGRRPRPPAPAEHGLDERHRTGLPAGGFRRQTRPGLDPRPRPDPSDAETDATRPDFPAWLRRLAACVGDLQYFGTDRIVDHHAWARVDSGELTRAYCYIGMSGAVPLRLGEPTAVERELGVGLVGREEVRQDWGDAEWDAWHAAVPTEQHVMRIAADWSVCPPAIADVSVGTPGIHGFPPGVEPERTS